MTDEGWIDWKNETCDRVDLILRNISMVLDPVDGSPQEMESLRKAAHRQMERSMDDLRDVLSKEYDPGWMQIRTLFDSASLSLEELLMRMIHCRILGNSRENVILRFLEAYANHIGLRGIDPMMLESIVRLVSWQGPDEMEESDE